MLRKISLLTLVLVLSLVFAVPALADGPNFDPAIYADGQAWGTKGTASLPAPTDNTEQSFDKLFRFTNGVEGQLPVAEAAPGNPDYNGGRWYAHSVTWNNEADAVLLTSYADIIAHAGELTITAGALDNPANFFQCPLLPVK